MPKHHRHFNDEPGGAALREYGLENNIEDQRPYQVVMYNDDAVVAEYVVMVLQQIFCYTYEDAMDKMLTINARSMVDGIPVATYPSRDEAEEKVMEVGRMNDAFAARFHNNERFALAVRAELAE